MKRTACLFFLFALAAFAQSYAPPDCQFTATFSSATPGTAQNNKSSATGGLPCTYWAFTYWTNGASGVSVKLEGTNDSAGSAGASYTALTAAQGTVNPAVGTNQGDALLCCDYYPWVRINPTTFSGTSQTMVVRVYGWRGTPVSPSGSSGPTANVNVAQWGGVNTSLGQKAMAASVPVVFASDQSNLPFNLAQVGGITVVTGGLAGSQGVGGLAAVGAGPTGNPLATGYQNSAGMVIPEYCTSKATVGNLTVGSNQLVAVSGSTAIRVCEFFWTGDTLSTFQLVTGTGATCTSPTSETGIFSGAGSGLFGIDIAPPQPLVTTAAKTLCVSVSASSTGGGYITYSQR